MRDTIFSIVGLILICFIAFRWNYRGYKITYFVISILAILFPAVTIYFSSELDKLADVCVLIILSFTLELPPALLIMSVRNLNKEVEIPRILSIINIVISCGLTIFLLIAIMAGVSGGMIG